VMNGFTGLVITTVSFMLMVTMVAIFAVRMSIIKTEKASPGGCVIRGIEMQNKINELEHIVQYWKEHYKIMHDLAADLQKKIDDHNKECINACGDKSRCGYKEYERRCPDCAKDWMIE
jgi:hypothetical protein